MTGNTRATVGFISMTIKLDGLLWYVTTANETSPLRHY